MDMAEHLLFEYQYSSARKRVQLFMPIQTRTSDQHAAELNNLFEELSFPCKVEHRLTALDRDLPLIVVCPVVSRLEPDIDNVLRGVNWSSDFVALVLHSGTEYSLPSTSSADKLTDMKKYRNMEVIDIAFTNEARLHQHTCRMIVEAKNKIKSFLDRYYMELI